MCLAADVPLIESGTAGYLGQVTVIKKVRQRFEMRMVRLYRENVHTENVNLMSNLSCMSRCAQCNILLNLQGVTECYECQPKPTQKTFPGCTIRNTPSEPIHCIVWAKYLFKYVFSEHFI